MSTPDELRWNEMQDQLMRFVLRYTRNKTVAEDIVHDVFLKVYERLPQLRDRAKISGWIFRIARNTMMDYFRRESKRGDIAGLDWDDPVQPLNDCVSVCLQDMLKTLPEKYRHALELAELQELSQRQLAQTLQLSYSGAKSRVQRAREMLRQKMDEAYKIKFDHYGNAIVCENKLPCGCN